MKVSSTGSARHYTSKKNPSSDPPHHGTQSLSTTPLDISYLQQLHEKCCCCCLLFRTHPPPQSLHLHLSRQMHDPPAVLSSSLDQLAQMILEAQPVGGVVIHTGAGLSTAAGIPDFRGPQGVWTLQAKGQAVAMSRRYEEVGPTRAHMVITEMVKRKLVRHVVTQNGSAHGWWESLTGGGLSNEHITHEPVPDFSSAPVFASIAAPVAISAATPQPTTDHPLPTT